jgi:hypothetical protein
MTGTQLIIPLEDEADTSVGGGNSGSSTSNRINKVAESAFTAPSFDASEKLSSTVLSDNLREQFESMKTVWRQVRRASTGEEGVQTGQHSLQELKRKERKTAVETALAVDQEISKWKNGIAELETMLAAEEDNSLCSSYSDDDDVEVLHRQPGGNQGRNVEMRYGRRRHNAPHMQHPPPLGFPQQPPVVPNENDADDDASSGL